MTEARAKEITAKVVLAGASGVGKTSISDRAFKDFFSYDTKPTVGSGFMKGTMNTKNGRVTLEVWDTAGQESFSSLVPIFFNKAAAAILVYDITDIQTFKRIDPYVSMVQDKANVNCIIVLVGNKKDLVHGPGKDGSERQVSIQEGQNEAEKIGAKYFFEVSALTGDSINDIFLSIVNDPDLVLASSQDEKVVLQAEPATKEGGCC